MGRGPTARHVAAWLLVVVTTTACRLVLGDDPVQCTRDEDCPANAVALVCVDGLCVAGEGDTSATGSTGSSETCGPAAECVPAAPAGWYGPVIALATDTEPAACPADAPTIVATGHAGLTAAAPICACNCDVTNVGCDVVVFGSLGMCAEDFASNLTQDVCSAIPIGLLPPSGEAVFPAMLDGCVPVVAEQIPPLQWAEHVRSCEAPPVACDDGTCMPIPDPLAGAATCIWDDGERACPDVDYTSSFVFHRGATDTRDCTPCGCGERSSCMLSVYQSSTCANDPAFETLLDEPQCIPFSDIIPAPMAAVGLLVSPVTPSVGECAADGGVPAGAAVEVDTFTLCCRP